MKKPQSQTFIVAEGTMVVGSFMTLKDALDFRKKSASRTARILADNGEFDKPGRGKAAADWIWVRQGAGK